MAEGVRMEARRAVTGIPGTVYDSRPRMRHALKSAVQLAETLY